MRKTILSVLNDLLSNVYLKLLNRSRRKVCPWLLFAELKSQKKNFRRVFYLSWVSSVREYLFPNFYNYM